MSALRWRPNGVCAETVGDIPGGTVHVKTSPRVGASQGTYPVRWLGFVESFRARKLVLAQKSKIVASAVTDGDIVASQWRDIGQNCYVLGMLVYLPNDQFGVFGVLNRDNWPIVISENDSPKLTIVSKKTCGQVLIARFNANNMKKAGN